MSYSAAGRHPQMWGGVECTINRVGDVWFNQLERSGHATRAEDLEQFAHLGIKCFRQPLLWEQLRPCGHESIDWSWADDRLNRLNALGIRPILGLVHHGSGPRFTSLVDEFFPEKFAAYAGEAARRYPWVTDYTPVNEPLTTARFSGLYGHWYPHGRDDRTFARAMINQCRAVTLAMKAIRAVNSDARLIQTEDLGMVHSTRSLSQQAAFENERRWLTWDLLCGFVDRNHPMASFLRESGINPRELDWFVEHPCTPDVIGINYYVTSERFLDDRLQFFPELRAGGNGHTRYVDVEAVRILPQGIWGVGRMIRQAWSRYRLPIALTEVHLGCHVDEQMRWLKEMFDLAAAELNAGAEVEAVTAWALLGAFDWNCLVTARHDCYEAGAFDIRSGRPRPTRTAALIRQLARGGSVDHPSLKTVGWWRRPDRLSYIHHETNRRTHEMESYESQFAR